LEPNFVCGVMVTVSVVPSFLVIVQVSAFCEAMVPKTAFPWCLPGIAVPEAEAEVDEAGAELVLLDDPQALTPTAMATAAPVAPVTSAILRRRLDCGEDPEGVGCVMAARLFTQSGSFLRAICQFPGRELRIS
jgi:hypothetical protein